MKELITLVNENDETTGFEEKLICHKKGLLHRAFSVFIYNEQEKTFLIQKRAKEKYHSGGLWSNSCCSHQRKDESMEEALSRCVKDELSLSTNFSQEEKTPDKDLIRCLGKFRYFAQFEDNAEHEIDNVFLYVIPMEKIALIEKVESEVEDIRWLTLEEIKAELSANPESYSAWFSQAFSFVCEFFA